LGAGLVALLVVGVVYAAAVNVDTFDAGAQNITISSGSQVSTVDGGTDVMGSNRDLELVYTGGSADLSFKVDYNDSNYLAFAAEPGVYGWGEVTWDGDSDPNSRSYTLGADLLSSSPANDGIYMVVKTCDNDTTVTLTGYDSASDYEELALDLLGNNSLQRLDLFFPFDDFTPTGAGVDWSNLGALTLHIDGTADANLDVIIDYMEARDGDDVREYGDLPSSYADVSAFHSPLRGLTLGDDLDAEGAANTSDDAAGDDGSGFDDEDGVAVDYAFWDFDNNTGSVEVVVNGCSGNCYVNGWIDWNGDGDFGDVVSGASEHIISDERQPNGQQYYDDFAIPSDMSQGQYYARFRICESLSTCNTPGATGVSNGEIEDYLWSLGPTAVTLTNITARSSALIVVLGAVALAAVGLLGAMVILRRRRA
jgi:hypothetical protein